MSASTTSPEGGRLHDAGERYDVDPLRVSVPAAPSGAIGRPRVVERLAASDAALVLVTAPAGYGKTTALAAWASGSARPVAWLAPGPLDNDRVLLLRDVAAALDAVEALPASVLDPLFGPQPSIDTVVLPRLGRALSRRRERFALVVDDVHVLYRREAVEALRAVLAHLPTGSSLVLSGRATPDLPLGALRLGGGLLELGPGDLAMGEAEAALLFEAHGLDVDPAQLGGLVRQTEGWPAGLRLAAIALATPSMGEVPAAAFAGDHRFVADYLREEVLANLPPDQAAFLVGSSILDRLSGPRCDEVLERTGSGAMLEALARSTSRLVVALDERRGWYRLHNLLGELLRAELDTNDPERARRLHHRASQACERDGDLDGAIRHAVAAREVDRAGRLVYGQAMAYAGRGRNATVGLWLDLFTDEEIEHHPTLALAMAIYRIEAGDAEMIGHWLDLAELTDAEQGGGQDTAAVALAVATLRALVGVGGLDRTVEHTRQVRAAGRAGNPWWGLATYLEGVAVLVAGDLGGARQLLGDASHATAHAPHQHAACLAQLAHVASEEGDWDGAATLAGQAKELVGRHGLQDYAGIIPVFAVASMVGAHAGSTDEARQDAHQTRFLLGVGGRLPSRARLIATVMVARAELALGDVEGARAMAAEAAQVALLEPGATLLRQRLDAVVAALAASEVVPPADLGPSSLTTAELRVLAYLPTHLSLREIADELFVSRNTVKTQAIATYRKLGVSSRSDAVATARSLGLLRA